VKICSVIVTFNRKELLVRCVRKCLEQNVENDVLIFDNHSTDGTKEYLADLGYIDNPRIIYYFSSENLGGSGGFSNGLKMAYDKGYDFIWLMDDDGYPFHSDALKEDIDAYNKLGVKNVVINSLVVSEDCETLSFKTGGFETKNSVKKAYPEGYMFDAISPFNGTLYSREIVERIGFPRSDFFIKGDETEYTYRAKSKGIKMVTVINSEFHHPIMPSSYRRFLIFNIGFGEEAYWKEYYKARNYVYIYRTYFSKIQLLKHVLNSIRKCMLYKEDKKRKIRYTLKGLKDGFANRFENIM
jgi:rhamnopyranosyl-N-acetylglucosaminyl-diphospho-decaprenol beta-1,3/1,4-galactofuranosyltransferase